MGIRYWNSDNAPAGEFLVLFGGFLLLGETVMLASLHGHLAVLAKGWGAIFLIGLPIWLSVTAGLSLASGESPAWAIVGFAITAAYLGFRTRAWLRHRRRIAKEPSGPR